MLPVLYLVGGMNLMGHPGNNARTRAAWAISASKPSVISGSIWKACPRPICSGLSPADNANCSLMNWDAITVWAAS